MAPVNQDVVTPVKKDEGTVNTNKLVQDNEFGAVKASSRRKFLGIPDYVWLIAGLGVFIGMIVALVMVLKG